MLALLGFAAGTFPAQPDPYVLLGQLILPQVQTGPQVQTPPQVSTGEVRKQVRTALEELGQAALPALIEATYCGQILTWSLAATLPAGTSLILTYQAQVAAVPTGDRISTRVASAVGGEGVGLEVQKEVVEISRGGKRAREPVKPDDLVTFKLTVRNTTQAEVSGTTVADVLFEGLTYVPGTTSASWPDGTSAVVPKVTDAAWVRWDAVNMLGNLASREPQAFAPGIPALADRALRDINPHPRWRSLWALSVFPPEVEDEEIIPRLRAGLESDDPRIVWDAAVALAFFGQAEAAPFLNQGLGAAESYSYQRWEAIFCLGMVHNDESVSLLIAILTNPAEELRLRQEATNSLGRVRDPRAIPALVAALEDPAAGLRWRAAQALTKLGDPSVIPALEAALAREQDEFAIEQMKEALERLRKESG